MKLFVWHSLFLQHFPDDCDGISYAGASGFGAAVLVGASHHIFVPSLEFFPASLNALSQGCTMAGAWACVTHLTEPHFASADLTGEPEALRLYRSSTHLKGRYRKHQAGEVFP